MVAYAVVAFALVQALAALRSAPPGLAHGATLLAAVASLQAALGIARLVMAIPLVLALAHQAVALALFGLAVAHWRASQMERAYDLAAASLAQSLNK